VVAVQRVAARTAGGRVPAVATCSATAPAKVTEPGRTGLRGVGMAVTFHPAR
jgi:hypothetical protein